MSILVDVIPAVMMIVSLSFVFYIIMLFRRLVLAVEYIARKNESSSKS